MEIKPLPQVPILPTSADKPMRDAFIESYSRTNQLIKKVFSITPADIGAATSDHNHDTVYAAKAQQAWQAPTLLNGWVNYGAGTNPAGYYKDSLGVVHLRGLIKGGTIGYNTVAFVLPAGYRPSYQCVFSTAVSEGFGRLDIKSTGEVSVVIGSGNTYASLDGITFRAEA